nr:ATP-binding protein [Azospirillum oleiclasticum]
MQAVLSRTHLSTNLENFLLPVFEAVSNAMHGIKALYDGEAARLGEIRIRFTSPNDPSKLKITVTDNGIGLDDENYRSFKTPFSGYKLSQHGRGFGRFIAFKVFARSIYSSRYKFFVDEKIRCFRFDISRAKEFHHIAVEPEFSHTGVRVEYDYPLLNWHDLVRELRVDNVADAIGSHFLPNFLYGWLPNITIQFDDEEPTSVTGHFKSVFVQSSAGEVGCDIDGTAEILRYSLSNITKTRSFKNHCLLFSAADRIVGYPRDLTNKLGEPHFIDEGNQKYIVVAVVSSPAFEARLNDSRTGLNLSPKTIESIVTEISNIIQNTESEQILKIKYGQSTDLDVALRENPILRLGLKGKSIKDYVASKPNNWKAEQFVSDLAIERYRASVDLSKEIALAANSPENYKERIQELAGKLDATKKKLWPNM